MISILSLKFQIFFKSLECTTYEIIYLYLLYKNNAQNFKKYIDRIAFFYSKFSKNKIIKKMYLVVSKSFFSVLIIIFFRCNIYYF